MKTRNYFGFFLLCFILSGFTIAVSQIGAMENPAKKIEKKQYELEVNSGIGFYMSELLSSAEVSFTNQVILLRQFQHLFNSFQKVILSYGAHLHQNYIKNDLAIIQTYLLGGVFSAFYHNNDFADFFSFLRGYSGLSYNDFSSEISILDAQNGLGYYLGAQYGFGYLLSGNWQITLGHRFYIHLLSDGSYWSQDIMVGVNFKW